MAAVKTETNPGLMTLDDLAAYEVKERAPVCMDYRAWEVCGMGPPSSGALTVGQMLGILSSFDLAGMPEPEATHLFLEAGKLAFQAQADTVAGLAERTRRELGHLADLWPAGLPAGVIHADLFTDNVFFIGERLSGLIDFYFACTDALAYDLAICLNAWCFEPDGSFNLTKGQAMIAGYEQVRPLEPAEVEALPILCRGSALRFMLTRLVDWLNVPPGALVKPKDPLEYDRKLAFHRHVEERGRIRARAGERARHDLHGRRLLREPGARRLGGAPDLQRAREGALGRRGAHHQQPHGADGGDQGRSRR